MSVTVRSAFVGEKEQCLDFVATLTNGNPDEGWKDTFHALLRNERGSILVAEEDDVLLGVVTVSFNLAIRYGGDYCQLEELIVDGAARGKNVGGLLIQAAIDTAKKRGCAEMGLYLIESTESNRTFYEKYGFKFVGSEMRMTLRKE